MRLLLAQVFAALRKQYEASLPPALIAASHRINTIRWDAALFITERKDFDDLFSH